VRACMRVLPGVCVRLSACVCVSLSRDVSLVAPQQLYSEDNITDE